MKIFPAIRFTAFLTAVIFSLNSIGYADTHSVILRPQEEKSHSERSFAQLSGIQIPSKLGKVDEVFQGNSGKTVVLIQDAHSIPEAQRNIQKLIHYFTEEYGITKVGLEGAGSRLDAQFFQSFPDREILKKALDGYFERGELPGGVAAAITVSSSGSGLIFQGIEDWKLYEEGLALYLAAMKQEAELLAGLEAEKKKLQQEIEKVYSKKLLEIDRMLEVFEENHQSLPEVMRKLALIRRPAKGSSVEMLLAELENEKGHWGKDDRKREEKYAQMGSRFAKEFEAYAATVKESLLRNEEERKLDRQGRELSLLKKLAKLELTRGEWMSLRASKGSEAISEIASSRKALLAMKRQFAFYKNAQKRDEVFLKNLSALMENSNEAMLVSGGFHTQGIAERLRNQNISYIVVMPEISSVPETSAYRDQMSGNVSWKSYFKIQNGRINLYEAFVRVVRDELLKTYPLKNWRDQIIRDLAEKEQIANASRYTRFLDELASEKSDSRFLRGQAATIPSWQQEVHKFVDGLRNLQSRGQLSEQSILNLLKISKTPARFGNAAMLEPGRTIFAGDGADLISRSEVRSSGDEPAKPEENWVDVRWNLQMVLALMMLKHPSLPRLRIQWGEKNLPQIRWVEGVHLERWAYQTKLSDDDFLKQLTAWVIQIGEAVRLLHEQGGFEHGDLSPRNIIIDQETGRPVLTDFDDYAESDLESLPQLLSVPLIPRIVTTDFAGQGLINGMDIMKKRQERFDPAYLALSQASYASAKEFVEKVREYFKTKWPNDDPDQLVSKSEMRTEDEEPGAEIKKETPFKVLTGSIFDPEFIRQERGARPTLAIDLDETLIFSGKRSKKPYLRLGIEKQLRELQQKYRLVLWTGTPERRLRAILRQFPHLASYFDLAIPREGFIPKNETELLAAYQSVNPDIDPQRIKQFYSNYTRIPPKDAGLLGYALVDNNPRILKDALNAPLGLFKAYVTSPKSRENITKLSAQVTDFIEASDVWTRRMPVIGAYYLHPAIAQKFKLISVDDTRNAIEISYETISLETLRRSDFAFNTESSGRRFIEGRSTLLEIDLAKLIPYYEFGTARLSEEAERFLKEKVSVDQKKAASGFIELTGISDAKEHFIKTGEDAVRSALLTSFEKEMRFRRLRNRDKVLSRGRNLWNEINPFGRMANEYNHIYYRDNLLLELGIKSLNVPGETYITDEEYAEAYARFNFSLNPYYKRRDPRRKGHFFSENIGKLKKNWGLARKFYQDSRAKVLALKQNQWKDVAVVVPMPAPNPLTNQTVPLAAYISQDLDKPLSLGLVTYPGKRRKRGSQSLEARARHVAGVFKVNSKSLKALYEKNGHKPITLLVVDDNLTTGSAADSFRQSFYAAAKKLNISAKVLFAFYGESQPIGKDLSRALVAEPSFDPLAAQAPDHPVFRRIDTIGAALADEFVPAEVKTNFLSLLEKEPDQAVLVADALLKLILNKENDVQIRIRSAMLFSKIQNQVKGTFSSDASLKAVSTLAKVAKERVQPINTVREHYFMIMWPFIPLINKEAAAISTLKEVLETVRRLADPMKTENKPEKISSRLDIIRIFKEAHLLFKSANAEQEFDTALAKWVLRYLNFILQHSGPETLSQENHTEIEGFRLKMQRLLDGRISATETAASAKKPLFDLIEKSKKTITEWILKKEKKDFIVFSNTVTGNQLKVLKINSQEKPILAASVEGLSVLNDFQLDDNVVVKVTMNGKRATLSFLTSQALVNALELSAPEELSNFEIDWRDGDDIKEKVKLLAEGFKNALSATYDAISRSEKRSPAEEFLKAVSIENAKEVSRDKKSVPGARIVLVEIPPYRPSTEPPSGLRILQNELAPVNFFELLINSQNQIIAIFPVLNSSLKSFRPFHYFDLSHLLFNIPAISPGSDPEEILSTWQEAASRYREDQALIEAYKKKKSMTDPKKIRRLGAGDRRTETEYYYVRLDPLSGAVEILSLKMLQFLQKKNTAKALEIFSHEPGVEKIIIPVFPTVYPPLSGEDNGYFFSIRPFLETLKLKSGDPLFVGGTGSGIDSWVLFTLLKAMGKEGIQVYGYDINPLAVASTRSLLSAAGYQMKELKTHDNLIDKNSNPAFPRVMFRGGISNTPDEPFLPMLTQEIIPLKDYWDFVTVLQRLAKGLSHRLVPGGDVLIWARQANPKIFEYEGLQIKAVPVPQAQSKVPWQTVFRIQKHLRRSEVRTKGEDRRKLMEELKQMIAAEPETNGLLDEPALQEEFKDIFTSDRLKEVNWQLLREEKAVGVPMASGFAYRSPRYDLYFSAEEEQEPGVFYKVSKDAATDFILLNEARNLLKLKELPGFAAVLEMGLTKKGRLWLKMQGLPNAKNFLDYSFSDPAELLEALLQSARIVNSMHARGLLHNDIKATNLLKSGSQVQLIDLEFVERPGEKLAGTHAFMAVNPEGLPESRRSYDTDVFSFIETLSELFLRLPDAESFEAVRHRYLSLIFKNPADRDAHPRRKSPGPEFYLLQKARGEWPKSIKPVIEMLEEDLEKVRSEVRSSFGDSVSRSTKIFLKLWKIRRWTDEASPLTKMLFFAASALVYGMIQWLLGVPELILVPFAGVISMVVHEFSHAVAAKLAGDMRSAESLSLKPWRHFTIEGVLFMAFFGLPTGSVLVNDLDMTKKQRIQVALAGPLGSLFLGAFFLALAAHLDAFTSESLWAFSLHIMWFLNLVFAFVSLLPFSASDGWAIIEELALGPEKNESEEIRAFVLKQRLKELSAGFEKTPALEKAIQSLLSEIPEDKTVSTEDDPEIGDRYQKVQNKTAQMSKWPFLTIVGPSIENEKLLALMLDYPKARALLFLLQRYAVRVHVPDPDAASRSEVRSAEPQKRLTRLLDAEYEGLIPVAIRYLDLFIKLLEEENVHVEDEAGSRKIGLTVLNGKRVYFGADENEPQFILGEPEELPGFYAQEDSHPVILEWDAEIKNISAVYIALNKEEHEYAKFEILSKKPRRGLVPFDSSREIYDESGRPALLIFGKRTEELVLRSSFVSGPFRSEMRAERASRVFTAANKEEFIKTLNDIRDFYGRIDRIRFPEINQGVPFENRKFHNEPGTYFWQRLVDSTLLQEIKVWLTGNFPVTLEVKRQKREIVVIVQKVRPTWPLTLQRWLRWTVAVAAIVIIGFLVRAGHQLWKKWQELTPVPEIERVEPKGPKRSEVRAGDSFAEKGKRERRKNYLLKLLAKEDKVWTLDELARATGQEKRLVISDLVNHRVVIRKVRNRFDGQWLLVLHTNHPAYQFRKFYYYINPETGAVVQYREKVEDISPTATRRLSRQDILGTQQAIRKRAEQGLEPGADWRDPQKIAYDLDVSPEHLISQIDLLNQNPPPGQALIEVLRSEMRTAVRKSFVERTIEEIRALEGEGAVQKAVEYFQYQNPAIRQAIFKNLEELGKDAIPDLIRSAEHPHPKVSEAVLWSLGLLGKNQDAEVRAQILEALRAHLQNSDSEVRPSLYDALAYLGTPEAEDLLAASLKKGMPSLEEQGIYRAMVYTGNKKILGAILAHLEPLDAESIPYALSYLIDSEWVAAHSHEKNGQLFAERFGYSGELSPELASLFTVLRESDRAGLNERRNAEPFSKLFQEKFIGKFLGMRTSEFKTLWDQRLKEAGEHLSKAGASAELGPLLAPYAAADSMTVDRQTEEERWKEERIFYLSRWLALSRMLEIQGGKLTFKKGIYRYIDQDFPDEIERQISIHDSGALQRWFNQLTLKKYAKVLRWGLLDPSAMRRAEAVLRKGEREAEWRNLSYGAQSALRLFAYDLAKGTDTEDQVFQAWQAELKAIAEEESISREQQAPSIGIEIQSRNVPEEEVDLWRAVLEAFGIPSLHRATLYNVVEASFRPAASPRAFLLALPILQKMGLHKKYVKGSAFHISLAGDLGLEAKWLALPLLLLRAEKKAFDAKNWRSRLRPLMSKGLLHLNAENQPADAYSEAPEFHTEIRTARFEENGAFQEFLPAVYRLGTALAAFQAQKAGQNKMPDQEKLAAVWEEYQKEMETLYRDPRFGAQALAAADWYESSGDSGFAADLPVIKAFLEFQGHMAQSADLREELLRRTREIFLGRRSEMRSADAPDETEIKKQLFEKSWAKFENAFHGVMSSGDKQKVRNYLTALQHVADHSLFSMKDEKAGLVSRENAERIMKLMEGYENQEFLKRNGLNRAWLYLLETFQAISIFDLEMEKLVSEFLELGSERFSLVYENELIRRRQETLQFIASGRKWLTAELADLAEPKKQQAVIALGVIVGMIMTHIEKSRSLKKPEALAMTIKGLQAVRTLMDLFSASGAPDFSGNLYAVLTLQYSSILALREKINGRSEMRQASQTLAVPGALATGRAEMRQASRMNVAANLFVKLKIKRESLTPEQERIFASSVYAVLTKEEIEEFAHDFTQEVEKALPGLDQYAAKSKAAMQALIKAFLADMPETGVAVAVHASKQNRDALYHKEALQKLSGFLDSLIVDGGVDADFQKALAEAGVRHKLRPEKMLERVKLVNQTVLPLIIGNKPAAQVFRQAIMPIAIQSGDYEEGDWTHYDAKFAVLLEYLTAISAAVRLTEEDLKVLQGEPLKQPADEIRAKVMGWLQNFDSGLAAGVQLDGNGATITMSYIRRFILAARAEARIQTAA